MREHIIVRRNRPRARTMALGVVMAVGTAILALSGSSVADVTAVSGRAFGASVSISLFGSPPFTFGPAPEVNLPPTGGLETASLPSMRSAPPGNPPPVVFLETGLLSVSTSGQPGPVGSSTSSSTVTNPNALSDFIVATQIAATCTSTEAGSTGTTTLTNAVFTNGTDVRNLPVNPAPNTIIEGVQPDVNDTFQVIFNEQVVTPTSIIVNAVRIRLLGPSAVGEIIIGHVECDVTVVPSTTVPPTTVTPTTVPPTTVPPTTVPPTTVPPTTLPPTTVPPTTVPPTTVPPTTVPPTTVPPTTVPPTTVPPTTVPPTTVSPTTVPPTTVPPTTLPPTTLPPTTLPPTTLPPTTLPPTTLPPTTLPPTTLPPTTLPPPTPTTVPAAPTTTIGVAPTAQADPSVVEAGQQTTVFGSGFPPNTALEVILFSDPVLLATTTTDAAGSFRVVVTIPIATTPGTHQIVVRGGGLQATTTITVVTPTSPTTQPGGGVTACPAAAACPTTTVKFGALARTGSDGDLHLAWAAMALTLGGLFVMGAKGVPSQPALSTAASRGHASRGDGRRRNRRGVVRNVFRKTRGFE